jgi:hypothetical protein
MDNTEDKKPLTGAAQWVAWLEVRIPIESEYSKDYTKFALEQHASQQNEALQKRIQELEKHIQFLELNETEMKYIINEMKTNPPE